MRRTAGPLAAAAVVAAGLPLEELWLGADDECSPAAGSEQPCELSALQLRGARLAERGLYIGRDLVADEGEEIGYRADVDAKDCERACDDLAGCRSFTYGFRGPEWGKCFLKDMPVSQESATTTNTWKRDRYRTYYKLQAAEAAAAAAPSPAAAGVTAAPAVPPAAAATGGAEGGKTVPRRHLMFSGRFDGSAAEKLIRETHEQMKRRHPSIPTYIVEASAGTEFGIRTIKGCVGMKAMAAFCGSNYGEATASHYSTYHELKYAYEHDVPIIPIKLCQEWPPKGGNEAGYEQNQFVFSPDLVYLDLYGKSQDPAAIADHLAEAFYKLPA